MAKKKAVPKHGEPEGPSQEISDEEGAVAGFNREHGDEPEAAAGGKAIKKAAAVREALAEGHGSPDAGTAYIKKTYGLEINPQHFSSIKSNYLKKLREGGGKPARAPRAHKAAPAEGYLAPPARARTEASPDVLLALESVKGLIAEHGADKVKRLVDLLS